MLRAAVGGAMLAQRYDDVIRHSGESKSALVDAAVAVPASAGFTVDPAENDVAVGVHRVMARATRRPEVSDGLAAAT